MSCNGICCSLSLSQSVCIISVVESSKRAWMRSFIHFFGDQYRPFVVTKLLWRKKMSKKGRNKLGMGLGTTLPLASAKFSTKRRREKASKCSHWVRENERTQTVFTCCFTLLCTWLRELDWTLTGQQQQQTHSKREKKCTPETDGSLSKHTTKGETGKHSIVHWNGPVRLWEKKN